MGLSCQQVSRDGLNWSQSLLQSPGLDIPAPREETKIQGKRRQQQQQQQQQQQEALKCPRCDSTNTKFCYYNNYNQSQPRHFCKTCKRHWTKGGTLRNVPVGGVRKNKRLKRSTPTQEHIPDNNSSSTDANQQFFPTLTDQNNNFSGILFNSNPLLCPPNPFMASVPLSPLLSLPSFPSQTGTHPYEDSSFNMLPCPFFENGKQSQLLFPPDSVEEVKIPTHSHAVSMPCQLSATSSDDTIPDASFWNTGDIWALLSSVGVGSNAQQEETNTLDEDVLDKLVC